MELIQQNLNDIQLEIALACKRCGRDVSDVELIAVSKTFPTDSINEAASAGQRHFGESKFQEAEPKIKALSKDLHWHFIGRLQRNKIRKILPLFEVVHAVDSIELAIQMDGIASELAISPQVFLQVNLAGEQSKGGFELSKLLLGMKRLLTLEHLKILGLMTIPPVGPDAESARPWFRELRNLRDKLEVDFKVRLPCLSMGMSGDFQIAIEEGATHVRVGSSIFGHRAYRVDGELA